MTITITAASEGRLQLPAARYTPDDALELYEALREALADAEWPRLTVTAATEDTDDEDGEPARLLCPRCGHESDEVLSDDRAIRWTHLEADMSREAVWGDYDGHGDYDGFLYRCVGCSKPVRLPEGWTEL